MLFKKGLLICLIGVDGSGKSSHAKSLNKFLSEQGHSSINIWSGTRPVLSFLFYGVTWILGYWDRKTISGEYYIDPIGNAPQSVKEKCLVKILRMLDFVDFQLKNRIKIGFFLALGKTVICDRYIYDLIAGMAVSGSLTDSFAELLFKTSIKADLVFLLDADEKLIYSRRSTPIEKIRIKRNKYLSLAKHFNFPIINSSENFSKNQKIIRKITIESLNKNNGGND